MIDVVLALAATVQPAAAPPHPALLLQDSACVTVRRPAAAGPPEATLDSVSFSVGGFPVSICYSRPRASQAQPSIGTPRVPYGAVWRTGGSTPAVIYTTRRISIAGLSVPPGRYLLYTVPGEHHWQLVVNRSVTRWADGAGYDAGLRSAEVGRVMMPAEQASQFVERLTLRPIAAGPNVVLFLEWERVQVTIPITPG